MVGLAVVLDSRGPVFYWGQRIGRGGKPFRMIKFRTMCMNADRMGSAVTAGCDPRVTRVGSVLRQWKLDEIPQFVNVLRGEMSLVGPRPESPCYVEHYTVEQRRVLDVRPGITGATQIAYRHEEKLLQNCADLETEYITPHHAPEAGHGSAVHRRVLLLARYQAAGAHVSGDFRGRSAGVRSASPGTASSDDAGGRSWRSQLIVEQGASKGARSQRVFPSTLA